MSHTPKKRRIGSHRAHDFVPLKDTVRCTLTAAPGDTDKWKDKDLLLIQIPASLNVNQLNGQEVHLSPNQASTLRLETDNPKSSKRKTYTVSVRSLEDPLSKSVSNALLTPSHKPGRLKTGPSLPQCLCVNQTVDVPPVQLPLGESSLSKVDAPPGLKQRWKPFGYKKPHSIGKSESEIEQKQKVPKKSKKHKRQE